jgi:mRNA interferase RelE/StbE
VSPPRRRSGRHPDAVRVVVRLTRPAFGDLETLARQDPQALRWALKKMLVLERDPEAGEPLRGALIGWRKIVVGDRDRRIVWRVTHDDAGTVVVDVAEVWAVGTRADAEVYTEMRERVAALPGSPATTALADAVRRLGRLAAGIGPAAEPAEPEPLPGWLVERLTRQAGLPLAGVLAMSLEQAVDAWTAWSSGPR